MIQLSSPVDNTVKAKERNGRGLHDIDVRSSSGRRKAATGATECNSFPSSRTAPTLVTSGGDREPGVVAAIVGGHECFDGEVGIVGDADGVAARLKNKSKS